MGCFATRKLAGGDPAACLLNDASGVDADISNQPGQCCIHTHKQSATQTRTWPRRCGGTTWNSYERHTGGRGNTNVDVHGEQNQPWQTGGGPSICSRSPSRQVRISLPTKVKPGRHEYRMMSPVESFTPTIASANTHTRKQNATLASAFQAQGPENIINTLSNEDWHPAGWSGRSRHKALTCTLGLAHQRSVRTCACTVQSEVATGKMSSTSTDSFVDG